MKTRGPFRSPLPRAVALAAAGLTLACSGPSNFLWVNQASRVLAQPDLGPEIHAGDVIGIRVWNQEAHSVDRTRVREDGKVSVPFLNDVEAAGVDPATLGKRLEVKLKAFIVNPVVSVMIHERRPTRVSVLGQVTRPGVYDLDPGAGVLHALAAAGGLTPFARRDGVYLLRGGYWADGDPAPARIRFRTVELLAGVAPEVVFRVRAGDVVLVE